MIPITNLEISKMASNKLKVVFDYPVRPTGFDHAMVAIVERDAGRDVWSVKTQSAYVTGSPPNVLTTTRYKFYNETWGRWIGISPSANTDDVGGRQYVINLDLHRTGNRVTLEFPYGPQVDQDGGGLEFYAIVAIVAVVDDKIPVAVLGDMATSAVIVGV